LQTKIPQNFKRNEGRGMKIQCNEEQQEILYMVFKQEFEKIADMPIPEIDNIKLCGDLIEWEITHGC